MSRLHVLTGHHPSAFEVFLLAPSIRLDRCHPMTFESLEPEAEPSLDLLKGKHLSLEVAAFQVIVQLGVSVSVIRLR